MPTSVKSFLRRGYDVLSRIPQASRTALIDIALKTLHSPHQPGGEEAATFGVDIADLRAAVLSLTFAIISLGGGRLTAEQFVSGIEAANLLGGAQRDEVSQLVELLGREQPTLKSNLDLMLSGRAVLPSFYKIDWSVDLRARYDREDTRSLTPVGIMFIDTDKTNHDLFLQVTLPQLDYLLEELARMRRRIVELEDWKNLRTTG